MHRTRQFPTMARFVSLFHVLPLAVGILTGCTTLVRSYDRIRAVMTKPEPNEETNNYGAFFLLPRSLTSEPSQWSGPDWREDNQGSGGFTPRIIGTGKRVLSPK